VVRQAGVDNVDGRRRQIVARCNDIEQTAEVVGWRCDTTRHPIEYLIEYAYLRNIFQ